MARAESGQTRINNPLDLVEHIASKHGWAMDRAGEDELTLTVTGQWTDYHVSLNWRADLETLHIASAFDAKIPENRLSEVYRLVAQINEQLWLGHFDVWLRASATTRRSSSWCGPARRAARRSPRPCSRPRGGPEPRRSGELNPLTI
jgi:hypothetical protein